MKSRFFSLLVLVILAGCKKDHEKDVIVIEGAGDITVGLNEFRQLLGSTLNTAPGATGGRREINWDGIPDSLLGKPLPLDFMNDTRAGAPASRQRGFTYQAEGIFQVSKSNFAEVNPDAAGEFSPFSGDKTFTNISSNLWVAEFAVPGQDVPASVRGFGVVFADVDLPNNTSLEFFNGQKQMGKFFAPIQKNGSKFSFLGVYFKNQRITSVRVQHGNGLLGNGEKDLSGGGSKDLVILDDFLYDEPVKK